MSFFLLFKIKKLIQISLKKKNTFASISRRVNKSTLFLVIDISSFLTTDSPSNWLLLNFNRDYN